MTSMLQQRPGEILARRRPRAVAMLWAWGASLGAIAGSVVASVASSGYGHHPDGDAPLWLPGGLPLLDLLRHSTSALGPVVSAMIVLLVVARLVGALPNAAALVDLGYRHRVFGPPSLRDMGGGALAAFPASVAIGLATLVVQAALVLAGALVAAALAPAEAAHLDDVLGNRSVVLASCVIAGLVLSVGVVADLARAAVVFDEVGALSAFQTAWGTLVAGPVPLLWAYAWRLASSWLPVGIGAVLSARVVLRGGDTVLVLAAFHQVVILGRVAIRSSWMACCLRAVAD